MSNFCGPDNPYNSTARDERDRQRKIDTEAKRLRGRQRDRASHAVTVPPFLARFVARETGTVVVQEERHGTSYDRKTPAPKPYPYDARCNPSGTVERFDGVVEANRLYLEQCARKSGGQQARAMTGAGV